MWFFIVFSVLKVVLHFLYSKLHCGSPCMRFTCVRRHALLLHTLSHWAHIVEVSLVGAAFLGPTSSPLKCPRLRSHFARCSILSFTFFRQVFLSAASSSALVHSMPASFRIFFHYSNVFLFFPGHFGLPSNFSNHPKTAVFVGLLSLMRSMWPMRWSDLFSIFYCSDFTPSSFLTSCMFLPLSRISISAGCFLLLQMYR